jgi:dipeptidyl aminopeptidase/acylaminoacyl peptidase
LEALLRVPYVEPYTGFDISPDGKQIAYSANPTGRWEIYTMPLDGSAPPQQVTSGPGAKFAPRWSPDGTRLAYVLDLDGGELYDIFSLDLAGGEHTNLTPDTGYAIQPGYSWSPDGSQIAFCGDQSGRFDTYVMDSAGGPPQLVLGLTAPDSGVKWSPDGEWLAVVVSAKAQDSWTAVVPAVGGEPQFISDGKQPIDARGSRWSPDSTHLAFCSHIHGTDGIGIYELTTGEVTWITQGEREDRSPEWSPDGRRLTFVSGQGPVDSLAVVDIEAREAALHQIEPGVCYRPEFTPDGKGVVFVFDNPRHPCDLWLLGLDGGSFRQLTDSLPPELAGSKFVMPELVHYPGLDDVSVPGLLYRPLDGEDLPPAILTVHGGPTWLTQVTWSPLVQHAVSRGWVVLAPNYRGSSGYGLEWQLANRFDLGGCDTRDVVAGRDYLANEGLADPERIAITGASWGGYLTMTSMTGYPDRWVGGSAVRPCGR